MDIEATWVMVIHSNCFFGRIAYTRKAFLSLPQLFLNKHNKMFLKIFNHFILTLSQIFDF